MDAEDGWVARAIVVIGRLQHEAVDDGPVAGREASLLKGRETHLGEERRVLSRDAGLPTQWSKFAVSTRTGPPLAGTTARGVTP